MVILIILLMSLSPFTQISWAKMVDINDKDFLSISHWIREQKIKEEFPLWDEVKAQVKSQEMLGKVLKCVGKCQVFRESQKVFAQHLSRLYEGDELVTEKNAISWIFLMDGTLVRLSPRSSISLLEVNISKEKIFFLIRLNYGHFSISYRSRDDFQKSDFPEKDVLSSPLKIKRANRESFERDLYQRQNFRQRIESFVESEEDSYQDQISFLNQMRKENNEKLSHTSSFMVVTPNISIISENHSFDVIYLPLKQSYFKIRSKDVKNAQKVHDRQSQSRLVEKFEITFRGYKENKKKTLQKNTWHVVSPNGKSLNQNQARPRFLYFLDFLSQENATLELAREIWLRNDSLSFLDKNHLNKKNFIHRGYFLWNNELELREKFLAEYTRRTETTQLFKSLHSFSQSDHEKDLKISTSGESSYFFQKSLEAYYERLKNRYTPHRMKIKAYSDLEFHVWTQKEGFN